MADLDAFTALLARVRARDPEAAAELVRRYEPELRRKVRFWLRLHAPGLRRLLDSADVCQSVLAGLFVRDAREQSKPAFTGDYAGILAGALHIKLHITAAPDGSE